MANSSSLPTGSLIYDAINFLYQTGMDDRRLRGFKILDLESGHSAIGDPRTVYYELDGRLCTLELPTAPIDFHVADADSFVAAIKKLSATPEKVVVIVGPKLIVGYLNYDDRVETIKFDLSFSPEHLLFTELAENPILSQREFVRVLTNDLYFCDVRPTDLLPIVRKLRWSNASSGQSVIRHDGESLGNNIEMEVAGIEGGVPDMMSVNGTVYQNFPVNNVQTHCTVEADAKNQTFYVRPILGTIESQRRNAVEAIVQVFQKQLPGALVISGSPY